jgi:HD-GYP domain-containing protein (c-di-GMP phosphodiesterase class II)
MSFETAQEEIRRCSGSQFDPRVVNAFLSLPLELWKNIHDSVTQSHQNQDSSDILCRV